MAIKPVLREELQNSLQMLSDYETALAKLPKGSLIKKTVKGNVYYYLVYREAGKVKFVYKGRPKRREIEDYEKLKRTRAKYRSQISQLKKQVRYLRGVLRGKEEI